MRSILFFVICAAVTSPSSLVAAQADKGNGPFWIWSSDATLASAPDGVRFFRKSFDIKGDVKDASLEITADNAFHVWLNEKDVGEGDQWQRIYKFDVGKLLKSGTNLFAVEARNEGASPAGLIVKLTYTDGSGKQIVTTDGTWRFALTVASSDWQLLKFEDAKWAAAKVLAPLGGGPWRAVAADGPAPSKKRFTVPAGFRVEPVVLPGTKIEGETNVKFNISFVNMCFDAKGRVLLSQEGGPIVLALDPDMEGVFKKLGVYCDLVTNCQGMCWVGDSLYLIGNGPKGTGLYRCQDTKNADKIDKIELIMQFRGGMGEHGPHAVIHGPDDKLYIVIGNHAGADVEKLAANSPLTRWPKGAMGKDQGKPGTTEDVLLPRQNDANGHAANILAPGGTIWRVDRDGKNPALFSAGFRNHFDAAFNPAGELFTFDSDMEWDEGLPWYRHVRVCHCTPGSDFVWRTGAANTPNYYSDSLPPLYETGRGSPTGVEFYDHSAFPPKYRGAFFMCDWSIGVLWAIHLNRDGATYKAEAEKFCVGAPMPITDCVVGPEGAMYFSLGGRGSQGSVHRIVAENPGKAKANVEDQPLAAWARKDKKMLASIATTLLLNARDNDPIVRADAIYQLGVHGKSAEAVLLGAIKDTDALVRRRACEALIRQGIEPPVKDLKPLLADKDIFVRTAARLVLQRIDPKKWADGLVSDANGRVAREAIIALCKIDRANEYAEKIFERLHDRTPGDDVEKLLEWLRTIQLALIHTQERPQSIRGIAVECRDMFPDKDKFVNRELAILLAEFSRVKELNQGVVAKLLAALKDAKDDRAQQIHIFYCLRVIKNDWNESQKQELLDWFENTKTWTGGASYNGFLQNILRDASDLWTVDERKAVIGKIEEMPLTALTMLRFASAEQLPSPTKLREMLALVSGKANLPRANDFKAAIMDAFGRSTATDAPTILRQIADADPTQKLAAARILARTPSAENWPYVVQGLAVAPTAAVGELIEALKKNPEKPKVEDAAAIRTAILSSSKLQATQKWKAVELLRYWTNGKTFGGDKKEEWKSELASWGRWFVQTYPKEPRLPDVSSDKPAESKYKFADLVAYLEKDPRGIKGDVAKGKVVFEKANCIKCHKFGAEGEGIGPDLSMVSKRFKRSEILESIVDPSKVISDQYRSSTISTLDGRTFIGLAAEQGGTITILLQDASKAIIKSTEVESKYASLISVMPEKLLDILTLEEIADLFAFMESTPAEKK